jgi:hypothetical protein
VDLQPNEALSMSSPSDVLPESARVAGVIQIIMFCWVPGKGWLATRRGISDLPADTMSEAWVVQQARTGWKAMMGRLKKEAELDAAKEGG